MAKFTYICLVLAVVVLGSEGFPQNFPPQFHNPIFEHNPVFEAVQHGDWKEVQRQLKRQQEQFQKFNNEDLEKDIKNLQPSENSSVFGESTYSYKTSSNINGEKSESSGGHRVVNDNGKVKEYDIEPKD